MKAILLLLALAALPLVGSAAAADNAPAPACAWNPDFTEPIETASGGVLHFHDGAICTVHVHAL